MEYTKYFSALVTASGTPNLQTDQFKQLMNIIHLEGQLAGVEKVIKQFKHIDGELRYSIVQRSIKDQITSITQGLTPKKLLESWK